MADIVNIGATANDGSGDDLRTSFQLINQRFQDLLGTLSQITWAPGLAISATPLRQWTVVAGQAYVAASNHIAGATFAADLAAGRWLAVDVAQVQSDLSSFIADLLTAATGKGGDLVGFKQTGAGSANRTTLSKQREWVSSDDFTGADVGAQVNAALAAGHKRIRVLGTKTLSTQILLNALSRVTIDMRDATITAASGLNVTLVRLINCTRCTIQIGHLDGNAAGQTSSSFGVDLNGGSHNKVTGGRVTNCKTYGVYNIYCQYAEISDLEADNNQQAGIAADVGPGDCFGVRVRNVIVRDNGLGGIGATSGLYLEGTPGTNHWFKGLVIDGVIAYGNRGAGVAGQGWDGYKLRGIESHDNYQQGIALFACLRGKGGDFALDNNDVGAVPGYGNGLSIDDTGVTPPSQYNTFSNIVSSNHGGYAVLERGTANNNSFLEVESTSDGAVVQLAGANSVSTRRGSRTGSLSIAGQLLATSPASGIGYGVGSGGAVVQATSKATGVTLNAPSGQITLANTAIAAGAMAEFVLTNSAIASNDLVCFNVVSGGTQAAYTINARPANGSANIEVRNNTAGSLSEAPVVRFVVIKAAQS